VGVAAHDLSAPTARAAGDGLADDGGHRIYRYSTASLCAIAAVAAMLLLSFHAALGWLWQTWVERPEYSHGPILPLIALFLIWQRHDWLERQEFTGSSWSVAAILIATGLYALGVLGAVYTLQQYALVVAVAALTLALTGTHVTQGLTVPLLLLVLMVPPPSFILNNLSAQLQLLSSALGVALIRAVGISVFLEGNVIDLGGYRLQVVEACDGMRYLFPLMTIGLLIAYFYKGAMWKRVLVFLASVPITVLMNSLRVGTIGVMVERWGPGMADGFLHEFQGWMVFMLSAGLLVLLAVGLNRFGHDPRGWREVFGLEFPPPRAPGRAVERRAMPVSFLVAAAGVALMAVVALVLPTRGDVPPRSTPFVDFPMALGTLRGHRQALDAPTLEVLQLDDYVLADFTAPNGEAANVYISYYKSQRDRRVVHSPRACIPGGGWHIERISTVQLPNGAGQANRMVINNGDARQLVYYWFDQRGRNLTSEWLVKWYLFWDALTRQRTDGAMIRLITPLGTWEPAAAADQRLTNLAGQLTGVLPRFVPR